MISLSCEHPDIEDFIEIKSDLERVTKANISIKIRLNFNKFFDIRVVTSQRNH